MSIRFLGYLFAAAETIGHDNGGKPSARTSGNSARGVWQLR